MKMEEYVKNNEKYVIDIFEKYTDLKNSGKKVEDFDNNDLWKIFEYYSCIQLSKEYKRNFYEYDDIDPDFKEKNQMTRDDTGIDCCDLIDTIVQCKLRKDTLTWKECSTFFGSQNLFCEKQNITKRNKNETIFDIYIFFMKNINILQKYI